jgi:sugar lactone lactonase YvrE
VTENSRWTALPRSLDAYQLGEGPHWDAVGGRTSWVDIAGGGLWAVPGLELDGPAQEVLGGSEPLGVAVPHAEGGWVCGRGRELQLVDDSGAVVTSLELEVDGVRLNDGKVDPAGNFWVGSKAHDNAHGRGRLFRLDRDGTAAVVLEGLTITNGLGWSPDGTTMYVTDSAAGAVRAHDVDLTTGRLGPAQPFVDVDPADGAPDGLTVDADGNVWIAHWGGRCVLRHAPDGRPTGRVDVDATHVTSATFAGPDLRTLVVTTAWDELTAEQRAAEPDAGRVFVAAVGGRGVAGRAASVVRTGWRRR